jgi:flagellar motor switch/type III secretory pathway protein FliN
VYAAHQARASLLPLLDAARVAAEASALLRQPVELVAGEISAEPFLPGERRVSLEFQGTGVRCWVEAEAALKVRAVEAALGLGPGLLDPARKAAPEVEGAWAAILVAVARRCALEGAPRLAGEPRAGEAAVVAATARLGGEAFSLRIGVPLEAIPAATRFDRAALAGLGAMPLTVPLVGARGLATPEDLAGMVPGAAWFPGEAWAIRRELEGWAGSGWLACGGAERGAEVELRRDGASLALVLGRSCGSLSWEPPMTTPPEDDAPEADLPDALAETPVVVRVEVASVTLEAQQWARLGPGDVVATGVRLGEPVVLRAGGSVFARGELCILEGELAVKILQRL